jgi:hypothetical protein
LKIIDRHDTGGTCCDREALFGLAFEDWLRTEHPDVYDKISNGPSIPGFGYGRDPADMLIALEYVDEFVAQSGTYPLDPSNSDRRG